MNYSDYLNNKELKEYSEFIKPSLDDMHLDNLISQDIHTISNEVGGQDGMYNNFPISRIYRDNDIIRVYYLTNEGGVAIVNNKLNNTFMIVTLGEDDGNLFLNSRNIYCHFYGNKLGFVYALSEALSLFNNIK